jgi:hypothetical protein
MTRNETIEYAKIVWGRMAETGGEKHDAIESLVDEGLLPNDALEWREYCSFCEEYQQAKCKDCPWPGKGRSRCNHKSPFRDWAYSENVEDDKKYGRAVFEFICMMK